MSIKFSIITPSYNMLKYLKLCSSSIADQDGVAIEHIVIDGGSTHGTVEWLKQQNAIKWISEKDNGMYDAVNKGLKIATGDILAYLNCDEQYLPQTLKIIRQYFLAHPEVDIVFGDMLLIDSDGKLIAYRKSFVPRLPYIFSSFLYTYSCTMFFRRKIFDAGLVFNINRKAISDAEFVIELIQKGYIIHHIKKYLSVFTLTNSNLGYSEAASNELKILQKSAPLLIRIFKYPLRILRLFEKLIRGNYFQNGEINYSIYIDSSQRYNFNVKKSSFMWK